MTNTVDNTIEAAARAILKARFYGCEPEHYDGLDDFIECAWEDHGDEAMAEAKSALSTLTPGSRLPGGMVVVPEEPTPEMLKASSRGDANRARAYYRAMIAAASEGE